MQTNKLGDLLESLIGAYLDLNEAEKEEQEARYQYLDEGGMSWGYHGWSYHDNVHQARAKLENIKKQIDSLT